MRACATCGASIEGSDSRRKWCSERCRRAKYQRPCLDCGVLLSGCNGLGPDAPERCQPCFRTWQAENPKWTAETIIAAIQRFATRYGRAPCTADFSPAHARHMGHPWRAARFYADGDYPSVTGVQDVLGTWSAAIEAAGLGPIGSGFARGSNHRADHLADEREAA